MSQMNNISRPENQIEIRFAGTGRYAFDTAFSRDFEKLPVDLFLCAEEGAFSLTIDGNTTVCSRDSVVFVPCDSTYTLSSETPAVLVAVAADCRIYTNLRVLSLYDLPMGIGDMAETCRLVRHMALESEFTNTRLEYAMAIDRALYDLFYAVISHGAPRIDGAMRLERYAKIAPVLSHIGANLGRNFAQDELSSLMGLSEDAFYRLFKSTIGAAPKDYLISERIRYASFLLACTNLPIATITSRIGYESPFYFSTLFKNRIGMPPTEYRERTAGIFE